MKIFVLIAFVTGCATGNATFSSSDYELSNDSCISENDRYIINAKNYLEAKKIALVCLFANLSIHSSTEENNHNAKYSSESKMSAIGTHIDWSELRTIGDGKYSWGKKFVEQNLASIKLIENKKKSAGTNLAEIPELKEGWLSSIPFRKKSNVHSALFNGKLKNGLPFGDGEVIVKFDDGETLIYKGPFVRGIPSGIGEIIYSDGGHYIGEIEEGSFNGKGKLFVNRSDISGKFEGNWINNDLKMGKGLFEGKEFTDEYSGEFSSLLPHGRGKLKTTYTNGDVFEAWGNFAHGKINGKAKSITKKTDGTIYEYDGDFVDTKKQGTGFLSRRSPEYTFTYVGSFNKNVIEGFGNYSIEWNSGALKKVIFEGQVSEGFANGKGKMIIKYNALDKKLIIDGFFINGNPIGKAIVQRSTNGQLVNEVIFYSEEDSKNFLFQFEQEKDTLSH